MKVNAKPFYKIEGVVVTFVGVPEGVTALGSHRVCTLIPCLMLGSSHSGIAAHVMQVRVDIIHGRKRVTGVPPRSSGFGHGGSAGNPRMTRTGPNDRRWIGVAPSRFSAARCSSTG
jgi:hypothetical protein